VSTDDGADVWGPPRSSSLRRRLFDGLTGMGALLSALLLFIGIALASPVLIAYMVLRVYWELLRTRSFKLLAAGTVPINVLILYGILRLICDEQGWKPLGDWSLWDGLTGLAIPLVVIYWIWFIANVYGQITEARSEGGALVSPEEVEAERRDRGHRIALRLERSGRRPPE